MNVFDLFASIKLDDSEYTSKLNSAKDGLASFGKSAAKGVANVTKATLAAGAAITGVVTAGAANTASYGDNIDKMSQKLGLSTEAFQKWDYVLGQSGADINSMQVGMKTLTNKLDEAKNGSEDAAAMFAQLGISLEDMQSMSREDIFEAAIKGFQQMEDSTERAALANDLFGKSGQELIPLFNTSVEETEALMHAAEDLGFVISEDAVKASADFNDAMDTMKRTTGGVKNQLMSSFLPSMTKTMDGITKVISGDKGGIAAITKGLNDFIGNINKTIPQFMDAAADIMQAFIGAIADNLPELAETAIDVLMTLVDGIIDNLPALVDCVVEVIAVVINTIAENLPKILEAGVTIITTLANSLADQAPTLIPVILDALMGMVNALIKNAPELLKAALALIKGLATGLINYIPELTKSAPELISALITALVDMIPEIIACAGELIVALATGLVDAIPQLVKNLPKIIAAIVSGLLEGLKKIGEVGARLVEGLWNGIGDKVEWIKDKIKGFGKAVLDGIKSFFGIASPSKVMAQIGEYMGEGLGIGWADAMDDVRKEMLDDMDLEGNVTVKKDVEDSPSYAGTVNGSAASTGNEYIIPIYIGDTMIDELFIDARNRVTLRSGGLQNA